MMKMMDNFLEPFSWDYFLFLPYCFGILIVATIIGAMIYTMDYSNFYCCIFGIMVPGSLAPTEGLLICGRSKDSMLPIMQSKSSVRLIIMALGNFSILSPILRDISMLRVRRRSIGKML